ncbi:hypothetical protein [Litorivivens sp.]|uniref:hypothetical protein n=1 Tax=Litorivivens sp. TaxID=2020868 RepID=UPI003569986D
MWFERLVGFREESPEQVRSQIVINGEHLASTVNGRTFAFGKLETPSLTEARLWIEKTKAPARRGLRVQEAVADVQELHIDPANAGALFQVASQFNLLEMVSPNVTPEQGVGIYEHDHTQGPACAIAAGAGTIYRNYFAPVSGEIGQRAGNQIDCLADLGQVLGNEGSQLWQMRNGYTLATDNGLERINKKLHPAPSEELDNLRQLLRIGIQSNTQVTLGEVNHFVTQAYCSALPVAYSRIPLEQWASFAQLILEAAYEATLCAGFRNFLVTGNNRIYLTLLGGGAFGNRKEWILGALYRALEIYSYAPLEVIVVSYGSSDHQVKSVLNNFCSA